MSEESNENTTQAVEGAEAVTSFFDPFAVAGAEEEPNRIFQHTRYRRFTVGPFTFVNSRLSIPASKAEEFIALVTDPGFPADERAHIIEINEQAQAAAQRPIDSNLRRKSTVVRGPSAVGDMLTAKDQQRMRQAGLAVPNLNPSPSKPNPTFAAIAAAASNTK